MRKLRRNRQSAVRVKSLITGALFVLLAVLCSVLFLKHQGQRQSWTKQVEHVDRWHQAESLNRESSLAIYGAVFDAAAQKKKAVGDAFFEPVRQVLRREAQFPQLRDAEEMGCVLASVKCRVPAAPDEEREFFGEGAFANKYDISLAVYAAVGSALSGSLRALNEGARSRDGLQHPSPSVPVELFEQCLIDEQDGIVLLDRARCDPDEHFALNEVKPIER